MEHHEQGDAFTVERLIDALGLHRTPELTEATDVLTAALTDPSVSKEQRALAWQEYAVVAEAAVEQSADYGRAQIAALIHKAEIFKAADDPLRYIGELDTAETYAFNAGLYDASGVLAAETETVGATLELSPGLLVVKLRGFVDEPNREYLRDLIADNVTLEDIVGDVYGMIIETGGDPDEVLRELGVIE